MSASNEDRECAMCGATFAADAKPDKGGPPLCDSCTARDALESRIGWSTHEALHLQDQGKGEQALRHMANLLHEVRASPFPDLAVGIMLTQAHLLGEQDQVDQALTILTKLSAQNLEPEVEVHRAAQEADLLLRKGQPRQAWKAARRALTDHQDELQDEVDALFRLVSLLHKASRETGDPLLPACSQVIDNFRSVYGLAELPPSMSLPDRVSATSEDYRANHDLFTSLLFRSRELSTEELQSAVHEHNVLSTSAYFRHQAGLLRKHGPPSGLR